MPSTNFEVINVNFKDFLLLFVLYIPFRETEHLNIANNWFITELVRMIIFLGSSIILYIILDFLLDNLFKIFKKNDDSTSSE